MPGAVCADGEDDVRRNGGAGRLFVSSGSRDIEYLGSAHGDAELKVRAAA